jgi:serine/threonine protein kinase
MRRVTRPRQVTHKKDGSSWALKELAKDTYDLYLLEREILIMKDLHHPGLVGLKEVSATLVRPPHEKSMCRRT